MSDNQTSIRIGHKQPSYVSWRGALLAELALARIAGLVVHKRPDRAPADWPYDFLVAADGGVCFFVVVDAFASSRMNRGDVREARELHWTVDADLVRRARGSQSPFFLFLFDADTEHGRYLRLDVLPEPAAKDETVVVRLPQENTLAKEGLARLVAGLQTSPNGDKAAAPA